MQAYYSSQVTSRPNVHTLFGLLVSNTAVRALDMVLLFIWCCMGRVVLECINALRLLYKALLCFSVLISQPTPKHLHCSQIEQHEGASSSAAGSRICCSRFAALQPGFNPFCLPGTVAPPNFPHPASPHPTPYHHPVPNFALPSTKPSYIEAPSLPPMYWSLSFFKTLSPQTRGSLFPSSRESGLTTLLLVFVHDPGFFLVPCCPTGGLTLVRTGVLWPANTGGGAHGTQRCCSTAAHM